MNKGKITQVIGPVVDVSFEGNTLPNILEALEIDRPDGTKLIMECQQHVGEDTVRAISMDSTDGLVRGMVVTATGTNIKDTVDANRLLGLPDDSRRYHVAAFMCRDLGIRSVSLLTNNPLKVRGLRAEGIAVRQRVPVYVEPNEHNVGYLLTKSRRMRHELEIDDAPENDEAIDAALSEDTKRVRVARPDDAAE